jgi:hypothetical protein
VPAERVGEPDDYVEERGDVNRVHKRSLAHAGGEDGVRVRPRQRARRQRELLEESERRAQALVDGRGAPVTPDRLPDLLAEGVRRDRAVGARSERALVER